MQPTWQDADKAYQLHHVACTTCQGAGRRPGQPERCPTGLELWTQYIDQHEIENPPQPQRHAARRPPPPARLLRVTRQGDWRAGDDALALAD